MEVHAQRFAGMDVLEGDIEQKEGNERCAGKSVGWCCCA